MEIKWQKHLPLGKSGDAKAEHMEMFSDLFKGMGTLPGEYSIEIKKGAKPVHLPAKIVPEALYEPPKTELDRMVKMGVITQVQEATDWCHNLVYVIKVDIPLRIYLNNRT